MPYLFPRSSISINNTVCYICKKRVLDIGDRAYIVLSLNRMNTVNDVIRFFAYAFIRPKAGWRVEKFLGNSYFPTPTSVIK